MERRSFLQSVLLGSATLQAAVKARRGPKIGVTDWNLHLAGNPEAVALARRLGFDGVEVSLGRNPADGKLPLDHNEIQETYLASARRQKIALAGTCLDILHVNSLKSDKLAQKWVADGIPITAKLNARVMLLPFFGKSALRTRAEMDYVGDLLKALAPEAEKAKVLLGLEDTISAEDNVRIMERSGSPAVKVYYDVGNSTAAGFDVVREIRWLGANRICQIHLKDNPHFLGEGKIDFPAVLDAIIAIGFRGFANLETDCPTKSVEADMVRNLGYVHDLIQRNA
jgi:sugar phosphate isomerase/epimerase